ncbi:MAG: helix-turn-helix domain-containing protein [Clostridiales bacterium]|nr:helix-turn-helix domain-containing protein [Clostridiales bacterium]
MDNYRINLKEIGKRIKELRISLHYTQENFSEQIYISTSYLALLETGKRTPSIDVLAQISQTYHISIDYLLFGMEETTQAVNQRLFKSLCSQYSEQEIAASLALAEFYLKNLSSLSTSDNASITTK